MRKNLLLLAIALLYPHVGETQSDRTIVLPGVTIIVGPGSMAQHGSVNGNCYGPTCPDFTAPSNIPDFHANPTPSGPAPAAPGGGPEPIALSPRQAEMANEMNISRAGREGVVSAIPSGYGASGGVPVIIQFAEGLTSQTILPQQLRVGNLEVLDALDALIKGGSGWNGLPTVAVPSILSEAEFRKQFFEKMLDPLFREQKNLKNRQQFYDGLTDKTMKYYTDAVITAHEEFIPPVITKLNGIRNSLKARLDQNADQIQFRIAANRPSISIRNINLSIAVSDRAVKFDADDLVLERMPTYLRQNSYLLPQLNRPDQLTDPEPTWPKAANGQVATAFNAIDKVIPMSPQGMRAKAAAGKIAIAANTAFVDGDVEKGERLRQISLTILDVASLLLPVVGPVRFLYEGITGTDIFTGKSLSDNERALRVLFAATGGILKVGSAVAMETILAAAIVNEAEAGLSATAVRAVKVMEERLGSEAPEVSAANAKRLRKLFDSVDDWRPGFHDNNGVPIDLDLPGVTVTEREADELGSLLVGENEVGYQTTNGDVNIGSADGLAQYRMPKFKKEGDYVANYQIRLEGSKTGIWTVNGHLTVRPPSP